MKSFMRLVFFGFALLQTAAFGQQPISPSVQTVPDLVDSGSEEIGETLQDLRTEIARLRQEYEGRLDELSARLEDLELQMLRADSGPVPAAPAQPAVVYNALNPAISVVGNFVGRVDDSKVFNEDLERIDNRFFLRETEVDLRVPIDPFSDGVLILAVESETPGVFEAGIEEGYVNLKRLPFMSSPLGLKFQVGRFRPAFGKFNLLHTHDLPQSNRSLVSEEFLGEEGFIQQGVSADFFVPSPFGESSSLNARLQVMGGGDIAVSPDSRDRLAYLGNLRWFGTLGEAHNAEIGWSSYWHPGIEDEPIVRLHGLDFMYRWKPLRQGQWKSYLLGGELFFTDPRVALNQPSLEARRPIGASVFTQWQFDRRKYAGVRWDSTRAVLEPDRSRRSVTPYFSYYFSEFLRLRVNYEHRWSDFSEEDGRNSVFFELNWIFGAHPPEPFWVNK